VGKVPRIFRYKRPGNAERKSIQRDGKTGKEMDAMSCHAQPGKIRTGLKKEATEVVREHIVSNLCQGGFGKMEWMKVCKDSQEL
jgi:hypothetical protein